MKEEHCVLLLSALCSGGKLSIGWYPWPETPWDGFFTGGVRRRRKNCERPALPPKDKEGPLTRFVRFLERLTIRK